MLPPLPAGTVATISVWSVVTEASVRLTAVPVRSS